MGDERKCQMALEFIRYGYGGRRIWPAVVAKSSRTRTDASIPSAAWPIAPWMRRGNRFVLGLLEYQLTSFA
jgi:hypothetical protein